MAAIDDTPLRSRRSGRADARGANPVLVWPRADGGRQLFALHAGLRRVTIGRGPSNDIAIAWDTEVSRVHAELERLGSEWTVVDEGLSRDGTWINGERLGARRRLRDGDVTVIDVRPEDEYCEGHIPGALSIPVAQLRRRLPEVPKKREVVAYCRGPYCVYSVEAVGILRKHGYRARRADEGLPDWRASGQPVAAGE